VLRTPGIEKDEPPQNGEGSAILFFGFLPPFFIVGTEFVPNEPLIKMSDPFGNFSWLFVARFIDFILIHTGLKNIAVLFCILSKQIYRLIINELKERTELKNPNSDS